MRKDDLDRIEKWATTSLMTAFALLLTLILCDTAAVAQSTAFNANGAFASAFGCSQSQTSIQCVTLEVFTGSTNGQKNTHLFYDLFIVTDPSTGAFQDTSGFGTIPNSAFQVHGQTDSLNVDTSKISPDVFLQTFCTFDPNTGITCNSFSGGVVTGAWTAITNLLTSQSGTFRQTFPNLISVSTGTFDSLAALVNVNVLGAAFVGQPAFANVGTSHNAIISVQVRH